MKVELAKSAGFCFGVKRAVDSVYQMIEDGKGHVYTLGPIIHNEQVVNDFDQKGVRVVEDPDEIGDVPDATLIIRSHGVSQDVIDHLEQNHISYADATCPFVKKIHNTVLE